VPMKGSDQKYIITGQMRHCTFIALLLLPHSASAASAQECKPISFEQVRQDIGPRNGIGVARIVLRVEDVTLENLVCLQQTLKAAHRDWTSVDVLVFTSRAAAVSFNFGVDTIVGAFERELRALYWIGASQAGDSLILTPLGWQLLQGEDYNTVVMFPVEQTPRCRIRLNRRCVLALERIRYPLEALRHSASGTVTLSGTIDKQGNPNHVEVAAVDVAGAAQRDVLIESALDNLRTWRLEPSLEEESFRVTFTFSLDPSLRSVYAGAPSALQDRFRREGIIRVEFGADQVNIRGASPE
jgi:TonB family protein